MWLTIMADVGYRAGRSYHASVAVQVMGYGLADTQYDGTLLLSKRLMAEMKAIR